MELSNYCTGLAGACGEAGGWVERNSELVRNEREGLLRELRRAGRIFHRCSRAASRKMCAGVFGPSQAGKSYLISALARDSTNSLMARFGTEKHDFISEINPEGGKESTGLVTRFTMTTPNRLPDGFPVQIRLLTETDLVKILANTYYADCEHKEDPKSSISETLKTLAQRARNETSHIDLDALEDLREYLIKDFKAKARVQELERSYWGDALALGPKLSLDDRILLYALIWDEVPEFTNLLRQLLKALEALGHPEDAFCPLSSLIPRDSSIIDVATLAGLDGEEKGETLEITTPQGRKATLSRAVVTALTAELTIVMDQKPAPYFDHTDLLDFPGYRSRYKFDDVRRELKKDGMLKEMFLRGKVAYLFQRYCAERELTSMLLCIGPSNQEVQDLPGVINDWICTTHGEQPEARAGKQVSLFFILTKFDMEFEQKKGAPSVETRWDNRLHASLLDFFGKQHDWPQNWNGKPFNNMFLLRNPNFKFDKILEYEGEREISIRPDQASYVGELESAFKKSQLVQQHFKDVETAWDAAMRLNDGGINYIRESLSPLCNPEIKRAQLIQSIKDARTNIIGRLKTFYQTDDKEETRKQKMLFCNNILKLLFNLEKRQQRLGLLLHELGLTDSDVHELHPEASRKFRALDEEEAAPQLQADVQQPEEEVDAEDFNPFDEGDDYDTTGDTAPIIVRDESTFFAEYIESSWVERLHALADNPAMQKYYMLDGQNFSSFVSELATGAARLGLKDRMAEDFRKAASYVNTQKENIIQQQSSIAAHILNSYVAWLGFNPLNKSEEERTVAGHILFQLRPPVTDFPHLQEQYRNQFTTERFKDWAYALKALIMENVNFDGQQTINVEENMKLGNILKQFSEEPGQADNS